MARELEFLLWPADQTSRAGKEIESGAIIDIALFSNMEHTSTSERGGASTGVISTVIIPVHYICLGDDNGTGSSNTDNSDDSIVSSSSLSYWRRTTKHTKE